MDKRGRQSSGVDALQVGASADHDVADTSAELRLNSNPEAAEDVSVPVADSGAGVSTVANVVTASAGEDPAFVREFETMSARDFRSIGLLALGFGCMVAFARMCSLGFAGYLSYEMSSALDSWFGLRAVVEIGLLVFLALAGRNRLFKIGMKSVAAATVCGIAAVIVFAVDRSGFSGPAVALLGGVSSALLVYAWMMLLCSLHIAHIVPIAMIGLVLSAAIVQGASMLGSDLVLIVVVATVFVAGALLVRHDSNFEFCQPDGKLGQADVLRVPWLTMAMVLACGFFATVLYGISEYLTWLYDWKPNHIVFAVAGVAVVVSTVAVMVQSRGWMHIVWAPLFVLFALAVIFSCLPMSGTVQIAVSLMMAAVFSAHFIYWMVFPSVLSALKAPHAFLAGILLALSNSSLAVLVGDALGSALPRSMQNLGSVSGLMAIVVAIAFAVTFVFSRQRQGSLGVFPVTDPKAAREFASALGQPAMQRYDSEWESGDRAASRRPPAVERKGDGVVGSAVSAPGVQPPTASASVSDPGEDAPSASDLNPVDALRLHLDALVDRYGLTPRESEVAFYTVQGFSCAYIAEKLVVSNSTVRFHQQNIYRKFEVHSRNELIELVSDNRQETVEQAFQQA